MADVSTLVNGPRNTIICASNVLSTDETDQVIVDITTLRDANNNIAEYATIEKIEYSITGLDHIELKWDHATDDRIVALKGSGQIDYRSFGGRADPQSSATGGNILLSTVGASAGAGYTLKLWIRPEVFSAGQTELSVPILSDQAVSSGRLTLVNGDFLSDQNGALVNTGAPITSMVIDSVVVGSSHWEANDIGLRNSSVPSDTEYQLDITPFGAGGAGAQFRVTINTEADTYSFHDDTTYDAVLALADATLSGTSAKGRSNAYSWTNANLNDRSFTSRFTVDSYVQFGVHFADLGSIEIRNPTNLTLSNLKISGNYQKGVDGPTTPFLSIKNTVDGLIIDGCEIAGNWVDIYDPGDGGEFGWFGLLGRDGTTSTTGGGYIIRNCIIHGGARCINFPFGTGTDLIIENNELFDFRSDGIVFNAAQGMIIQWNDIHSPLGSPLDTSHGDFIQCIPNANLSDVKIYGNRLEAARSDSLVSRELYQGFFFEDILTANNYIDTDFFGNIYRGVSSHGISLYNPIRGRIVNNTCLINPDWTSESTLFPRIRTLQHQSGTGSDNVIADNIAFSFSGLGIVTNVNNQVADPTTTGQSDSYDTLFDGPSFTTPDTIDEVITAFTPKAGSVPATSIPRIGAIGGGYVDYDNRIYDLPRINPTTLSGDFTDATGIAVSTLTTVAAPVQITDATRSDGTASTIGVLVEMSGGNSPEVRVTSDVGGLTVVTDWTSGPNIIAARLHYIWLRDTSSSQGESTTTVSLNVGDQSVNWAITTVASDILTIAALPEVVNTANLTQYTLDAGIREADEGKIGVVAVATDATNGPRPTSVTIGGAAATRQVGDTTNGSIDGSCTIWSVAIPASATSDVVLNYAGGPAGVAIQPWLLSNADGAAPTDTVEVLSLSQGSSINGAIDGLEDGGLILGAFTREPFSNGAFSGTGPLTEDADTDIEFGGFVAASREETTARTAETITYTSSFSWHHMVGASWDHSVSFAANAVEFDGTNDWLDYGDISASMTDGKVMTCSFWCFVPTAWPSTDETILAFVASNSNTRFVCDLLGTSGVIRVFGRNSAQTTILNWEFGGHPVDEWFHVMFSFDLNNTDDITYYLNGSSVAGTKTTFTNDNIDFTVANCEVGSRNNGSALLDAYLAELWATTTERFDLTVQANREKYRSSSGKPVDLGSDGSTPTGTQPQFFHTGPTGTWHTNAGSITGATENGALTDAPSSPSD